MKEKINAAVVGGAGYTGGETVRLLLRHPRVHLTSVQSRSQAGKFVHEIHHDIIGDTELKFDDALPKGIDVLFLCLGHGESKKFLSENVPAAGTKIIDLGNDFRLGDGVYGREFIYGLPEFQRDRIRTALSVANPGCFATTIQLGLLPLAKAGLLGDVHTTGITGSTGAGQKVQETSHFTWRTDNISAYKTLTHRHISEIGRTLQALQPGFRNSVHFVPWRGDFARGIFVTSVLSSPLDLHDLTKMYTDFYQDHPFTHVSPSTIDLKQVVNTNKCLIQLEKVGEQLAVHSVTDNLLKGASGQAVQNMNLMVGLAETEGLLLKGSAY
jgi:N-acetyl-gamma-glutamyl-phosphate reductase